jgi:beta-phosphoglucomutase-like phosphatase (HAD superfamily)
MSEKKGMIFDFNGTLVLDSHIHKAVWTDFFPLHGKKPLSEEEMEKNLLGCGNTEILTRFFSPITPEEIERLTYEKEAEYRRRAVLDPTFVLVPGVEEFLDYLKAEGYPMMIATGSEINNVKCYFEYFNLERWFDWDHIIYDDGIMPCKPDPGIYLRSAALLGRKPEDCMVFEDSLSGVLAAKRAKIGRVYGFGPGYTPERYESVGGVDGAFDDFANWKNFDLT